MTPRTAAVAFLLVLGAASAAQNGAPINAKCPIKPNQVPKADVTVVYHGQVIGFC